MCVHTHTVPDPSPQLLRKPARAVGAFGIEYCKGPRFISISPSWKRSSSVLQVGDGNRFVKIACWALPPPLGWGLAGQRCSLIVSLALRARMTHSIFL